jgi:hypothetical protein
MDRPGSASTASCTQPAFRIELSLTVADAAALWNAAFAAGLETPGASRDDLVQVIGPAEDPDLAACLAMLAAPAGLAGCELDDFELVELRSAPKRAPANDMTLQRKLGASA